MPDSLTRRNPRMCGAYELLEKIGQGGMSRVYKARDTRTDEIVAVKIAAPHVVNDVALSRRFKLEFDLVHPLEHPHLVKVLESGKDDKTPFLAMEYIDGPSLSKFLKAQQRLSETDALAILLPIINAVAYLHGKHIIHRDIKPDNILLASNGHAKLADLGLVKNLDSLSGLTRTNLALGTMQFASPEQFDDARSADSRSDIYSLAATMYLMLTGEYPFGKGSTLNVVARKMHNQFEPPLSKVPQLRHCVDRAIRLALDVDREKRPASINEFMALLLGSDTKKRRDSAPAAAVEMPKPKASAKRTKELRRASRYAVEMEAACRAVVNFAGKPWPAWITDISKTGLCLHAQRRFEVGSVVEITFTLKEEDQPINKVVRVRWARAAENKSWLLGCELVKDIADDEMDTILGGSLDRTKVS